MAGGADAELNAHYIGHSYSADCFGNGSVSVRKPTAHCVGVFGLDRSADVGGSTSYFGVAGWDGDWAGIGLGIAR